MEWFITLMKLRWLLKVTGIKKEAVSSCLETLLCTLVNSSASLLTEWKELTFQLIQSSN